MSISSDPRDGGPDEYADYEVQNVGARAFVGPGNDNVSLEKNTIKEPVSPRGIDSDEIAELVAMRFFVLLESDQLDGTNTTEQGSINGEASLGINLTTDEHVSQAFTANPTSVSESVEFDTGGSGAGVVQSYNFDEPGQLYAVEGAVSPDLDTGGGKMSEVFDSGIINMRANFGTGPFVDKTDDITIFTELGHDNVITASSIKTNATLYWNVFELPEGRASFSRP